MSLEFTRLSDVTLVEEATNVANVLIEEDGEIKRVPKTEVGGRGAFATAIIKHDEYDNHLPGAVQPASESVGYTCLNMTFDEAYNALLNSEPLSVYVMDYFSGYLMSYYAIVSIINIGKPCIKLLGVFPEQEIQKLYWTADGISTEPPAQPV